MEMMDHGRISYNFRQICIQIERLTNRILEEQGLTAVQAHVLQYILCHATQGTSLTEIHRDFGCSMATLSCVVKRLKEKGYVHTQSCTGDDRCKLLFPTDKGRQAQVCLDDTMHAIHRQVYGCLSQEDLAALTHLQQKLLQNLLIGLENTQKEVPKS